MLPPLEAGQPRPRLLRSIGIPGAMTGAILALVWALLAGAWGEPASAGPATLVALLLAVTTLLLWAADARLSRRRRLAAREDPGSASWIRALEAASFDGVLLLDRHALIRSFNGGAERLFGYAGEEIKGHSLFQIVPLKSAGELAGWEVAGDSGGRGVSARVTGHRKDGAEVQLEIRMARLELAGAPQFLVVLRPAETPPPDTPPGAATSHLGTLLDAFSAPMLLLDRAGRLETCNHAAEAQSNASRDSLKGVDFAGRLLDPADRDRAAALFRDLAPGTAAEIESVLPGSPESRVLRWTFVAFEEPADQGSLLAVAETVPARPPSGGEDDTIARLARELARRLNQHLTAVLGYGELLSEREHGGLDVPEGLAEIRRAAHRIADLAAGLQDYAGSCRVRPEPVDLDRLVREYIELVRPRLREGSSLTASLDAGGAPALADRLWLERALATLGGFVREMSPAGGRLEFRTSAADGGDSASMLLLEVRGADAVLPAEMAARLFEPFQPPGDESLMFPALRNAISRCGGSLDAEATPGGGVAFRIRLPAAPHPPPA